MGFYRRELRVFMIFYRRGRRERREDMGFYRRELRGGIVFYAEGGHGNYSPILMPYFSAQLCALWVYTLFPFRKAVPVCITLPISTR